MACDKSESVPDTRNTIRRESLLFLWLILGGLFILPGLIYIVGNALFGEYGGSGFTAFYGNFHSSLRDGETAVWFLVLTPYLVWQLVRLTLRAFRMAGRS